MPSEIKIKNIPTGYQSIITNGKHTIIGDEPVKAKGTDLGLMPTELVLAGIAMCKAATIRNVARRNQIEIGDVDAELSQVVKKDVNGDFKTVVNSSIKIDGDLTDEQRSMLIHEADNCYVTKMLKSEWQINESSNLS